MKPTVAFMRGAVARRILGLFLLCALLPIGTLALLSLREMSGKLREQTNQRLRYASKNVGMEILDGLAFLHTEMEAMAVRYVFGPGTSPGGMSDPDDKVALRRFLSLTHFRERSGGDTFFGTPCPPPPLTDASRKHLSSGEAVVFVQGADGAPPRVFMAIATDRKLPEKGHLVGEIHPGYLKEMVENALSFEGEVSVLDSNGTPLYRSIPLAEEIVRRVVEEAKGTVSGQIEWARGGDTYLVNYRTIFLRMNYSSEDWIVVIAKPKAEAFAPMKTFARTFVLVVALTILVVALLGIAQIRKSLVPLEKLREGTRKISGGDFENRIEVSSGDEFEDLARSFNAMSDQLRRQFDTVTGMGRITRMILSALDRERIVDAVIANLRSVIPCDWVSFALLEPGPTGTARVYSSGGGTPPEVEQTFVEISPKELENLRSADSLVLYSGTDFPSLLSPLSKQGISTFFLLPIFLHQQLCGILTLGYFKPPEQSREDMLRARQIGDQITVALLNAGLLEELSELNWGTLTALARAVDANSPWTAGHSERVTAISLDIGRELGLTTQALDSLHQAGLLHDIGKIAVPGYILDKPAKLTDEEYLLVKEHPGKGTLILEPINAYKEIIPIVAQHHEWFNGKGYPKGLAGESICLGARILAVADVYDALISDRPYRRGLVPDRVLAHIRENAGTQFDPVVVEAYCRILSRSIEYAPS